MKNIKFKSFFASLIFLISLDGLSLTLTIKNETKFPIEYRYRVEGRNSSSLKRGIIQPGTTDNVKENDCLSDSIVVKPGGDKPENLPSGGSLHWTQKICTDLTISLWMSENNKSIDVIENKP